MRHILTAKLSVPTGVLIHASGLFIIQYDQMLCCDCIFVYPRTQRAFSVHNIVATDILAATVYSWLGMRGLPEQSEAGRMYFVTVLNDTRHVATQRSNKLQAPGMQPVATCADSCRALPQADRLLVAQRACMRSSFTANW